MYNNGGYLTPPCHLLAHDAKSANDRNVVSIGARVIIVKPLEFCLFIVNSSQSVRRGCDSSRAPIFQHQAYYFGAKLLQNILNS